MVDWQRAGVTTSTGASSAGAIRAEIARRQTERRPGVGRARWIVERTFAWLHHFKRHVRYDCRHEIHDALPAIGCCLVCFRRLRL
jgi:transposase